MNRVTGRTLAAQHGVDAVHVLYRKTGDWFHLPERYPSALMDEHGYLRFAERADFDAFIAAGRGGGIHMNSEKNTLTIKDGIAGHERYVPFESGLFPDEIVASKTVIEGARRQVTVNAYERDTSARRLCILRWGLSCAVCGMDFLKAYGPLGNGFIHVHHLTPISSIGAEYVLNPERDLRPVCPNCHAMLHRRTPPLEIEELRSLLKGVGRTS